MSAPDIYDPENLGRRQQMAAARLRRESERLAFLGKLVDAQRHAVELKDWITAYERPADMNPSPELQRMVAWVAVQIDDLERILSPERISETLKDRDLFPEVDSLSDPLGEPPGHHVWGHSAALKPVNAL